MLRDVLYLMRTAITRPSGSRLRGIAEPPARASTAAHRASLTTGFTKKDSQLRRFGSPGSRTIDFAPVPECDGQIPG